MGGVELTSRDDPLLKLFASFYKEKLGGFARFCIITVGLLGGIALVSTGLELFLQYQKKQAFFYGFLLYAVLLLIAFLIYGVIITIRLFKNPRDLFGFSTELEHPLGQWMSNLYGIERTLLKDSCVINPDGSFKSNIELITTATAQNVNAVEIYAAYLGPLSGREIVLPPESFRVTPKELGPLDVRTVEYLKGWYELRFVKDLPTDRQVTIEYEETGGADSFARSPDKYDAGIPFDYLVRTTFYPTRKLTIEIYFEEGYPLSTLPDRPRAVVWYGNAKVEHRTETARAERNFKYENRKATLRISSPVLGLQYAVRWVTEG